MRTRLLSILLVRLLPLGLVLGTGGGFAQAPPASSRGEYEVRWQYILNVARLIEWPAKQDGPMTIGILGRDPFGPRAKCEDLLIHSRKVQVRRSRDFRELADCEVVYICSSEEGDFPRILRFFQGRPVLTFGEGDAFQEAGGMVCFHEAQGRIRLALNRRHASQVGLNVSSWLLAMVKVVEP